MLTDQEIARIVGRIAARLRPQRIVIFGSYAKGAATSHSDLDLLVIADTALPMARRADEAGPAVGGSLVPVDVHVYTPEEVEVYGADPASFLGCVLRTGRVAFTA